MRSAGSAQKKKFFVRLACHPLVEPALLDHLTKILCLSTFRRAFPEFRRGG
jgi:hypothetical protein